MATLESIREAGKKKREAEERNPLLKLNLGELVMEMQRIASADITVLMTPEDKIEDVPEQKAKVGFIPLGETKLELVQPTTQDTALAKFLDRTGGGLHHICLEVQNIVAALKWYKDKGIELIDTEPRTGAHNKKIAFLHPKSTKGVLIELCQCASK